MKSAATPRGAMRQLASGVPRTMPAFAATGGLGPRTSLGISRALPGQAGGVDASQVSSLAGLGAKMQQEATRQGLEQQVLAAQQQANGLLGALAGCAAGSAMRVQVVGGQSGQW
jgi:hypothetical protein